MLGAGIEAFDQFIKNQLDIHTVKDIWNIVKDFKYGIHDDKLDKRIDWNKFDYSQGSTRWRILSPKETLEKKYGVCWDQALCISYLADKAHLKYNFHFVSDHTNSSVHTFVFIKEKNQWWYPESSYYTLGLHGPFDTEEEALEYFVKQHKKSDGHGYFLIYKENIDVNQFFNDRHISVEKFLKALGVPENLVKLYWTKPWWEGFGIIDDKTTFDYDKYLRVTKIHKSDGTIKNWDYTTGTYKK